MFGFTDSEKYPEYMPQQLMKRLLKIKIQTPASFALDKIKVNWAKAFALTNDNEGKSREPKQNTRSAEKSCISEIIRFVWKISSEKMGD